MDSIEKKRQELLGVYPNQNWAAKVKKMSDAQVVAVYMRLKNQVQSKEKK